MNPDCTYFYVAGSDGVYYYDADPSNGELSNPRQVPTAYTPKAAAVHASGSWLYVSGDDYAIHRYSIENGTPSSDVTVSSYSSQFLKSVSAEYLVSYSTKDNAVVLWRVDSSDGTITQAEEISVDSPSWVDFRLAP